MSTLPATLTLPPRTLTGRGSARSLLGECAVFGGRGVLVHGRSLERSGKLAAILGDAAGGRDVLPWRHPGGEPTLDQLEELLSFARAHGALWIAGVGGGSVMDLAKGCAGLIEAPLPAQAYQDGEPIEPTRTPFIAVPSTAGTGSESTIVAVFTNAATGLKRSIRHATFMARVVILDPELLEDCPPPIVAASGLDAFVQALESYISVNATWFTDRCAFKAIELINGSLEAVFGGATGAPAEDLLQGSYLAGMALSNARLGVVHGLAHPLGARYHQPHGLVCGVCLPHALAFNRDAAGEKLALVDELVGEDLLERTNEMIAGMGIESPFAGKEIIDGDGIVRETLASGSTAANPRAVTEQDVHELLDAIFA